MEDSCREDEVAKGLEEGAEGADVWPFLSLRVSRADLDCRQIQPLQPMYFGTDYYPEHWVYPYAGTPEEPESRWQRDAELMVAAGINVVRMGEFAWGLYEPQEGKYNFDWMARAVDVMANAGLQVMLGTPTAAPPIWLARKHPEILPLDENGLPMHEGTRKAYCMNSSVYWDYCKKIITVLANALGRHP